MEEFEVFPKFDNVFGTVRYSVNIGKDVVEFDGVFTEQIEPLSLRKLWDRFVTIEER
jgi:hypothetical protein